ncbi:MAG: hypothetical protein H6828_13980 [Planctomycetes bacterium]|nr:hypothetical protein [Planctomycetota bacterium]
MAHPTETICFTCGQPTGLEEGGFPRLNTLRSGQPCPTCRDRLLESLPGILPGAQPEEVDERDLAELGAGDERTSPAEGLPRTIFWGSRDDDEPA